MRKSYIHQRKAAKKIVLDENTSIKPLDQYKVFNYLGIDENDGILHKKMKAKLEKEYYRRTRNTQDRTERQKQDLCHYKPSSPCKYNTVSASSIGR